MARPAPQRWLISLVAPLLPVDWQLENYTHALSTGWHGPHWRLLVMWLMYAQALLLLAGPLVVAELLGWFGFTRTSRWAFIAGSTAAISWFVIDVLSYQAGGYHATYYAHLLLVPGEVNAIGGYVTIARNVVLLVMTAGISIWISLALLTWLTRPLQHRSLAFRWTVSGALAGLYVASVYLPTPFCRQYGIPTTLAEMEVDVGGWSRQRKAPFDNGPFAARLKLESASFLQAAHRRFFEAHPLDTQARVSAQHLPNVVMFVVESLRADALNPKLMPRLDAWSRHGLRLRCHRSGGNASNFGMFSLLYARSPARYTAVLDATLPPQMCQTLRASGYRCSYIGSINNDGICRMECFLNASSFDTFVTTDTVLPTLPDHTSARWPELDRRSIAMAADVLSRAQEPRFLTVFLNSTHFPYAWPPGQHRFKAAKVLEQPWMTSASGGVTVNRDRYNEAVAFIDDLLGGMVERLDLAHTIVIVTGDHGESLGDDGSLTHGDRVSDVEMQVPCVLAGPGFSPGDQWQWTAHMDVLPTLLHTLAGHSVPISGCDGDDILEAGFNRQRCLLSACVPYEHARTLVMAKPGERLAFRLLPDSPYLQVVGAVDELGRLDQKRVMTQQDAARWWVDLRTELARLIR